MSVAFIGLGSMGAPLAHLIAKGGHDLAVYDPAPAALKGFEGAARLADSPMDAAAAADFVCICVRDEYQVNDVIFGDNGVARALKADAVIVIHSTISVATTRTLAGKIAERGAQLVDAPVSRTSQKLDQPFVFCMLGGDSEAVGRVQAIVDSFSTGSAHMGPVGTGMSAKIANNMVTWVQIVVGTQAAAMAIRSGVGSEQLVKVMKANGNLTPTMGAMLGGKIAADIDPARQGFLESQAGIGEKDLQLAASTLSEFDLPDELALAAERLVRSVMTEPLS